MFDDYLRLTKTKKGSGIGSRRVIAPRVARNNRKKEVELGVCGQKLGIVKEPQSFKNWIHVWIFANFNISDTNMINKRVEFF